MEQNISLLQAWGIIRKHLVAIFLWAILFGVGAWGIATFVMTPKYSADTQLLVSRKSDTNSASNNGAQFQDQQADVQMITTYKDIITNQVVLDHVSHELKYPSRVLVKKATPARYETTLAGGKVLVEKAQPAVTRASNEETYDVSSAQLKNSIKISNQQNSQVFAITVTSGQPKEAARIANVTAQVFKTQIKKIMSVNNVTIVSKAVASDQKVSPRTTLLALLGIIIGLILGLSYAFIRELTDTTIKDETVLSETLKLTNLGHITRISGTNKLAAHSKPVGESEGNSNPRHLSNRV